MMSILKSYISFGTEYLNTLRRLKTHWYWFEILNKLFTTEISWGLFWLGQVHPLCLSHPDGDSSCVIPSREYWHFTGDTWRRVTGDPEMKGAEGEIRRGLRYRLQGDCSYWGGGINMSDVRVSHCVPVPVTSRCSLSLGSSVPASLLVTRSQPEPGPESRLSALTGGCLLRLRVSQKQTRSGGEQSSLTSPVQQNISREQKMMEKNYFNSENNLLKNILSVQ